MTETEGNLLLEYVESMRNGFTPSGTFISPYSYIVSWSIVSGVTYYSASNAYQILLGGPLSAGVDGTDFDAVMNAAVAASSYVYVKTNGVSLVWHPTGDAIPNYAIIEADVAANFVITSSTVATEYIDMGIFSGLRNVSINDKYGTLLSGGSAIGNPRVIHNFYNATTQTILTGIPAWKNSLLVANIGRGGALVYDVTKDNPGVIINNYGIGDNIFLSSNVDSIGNLVFLYSGSPDGITTPEFNGNAILIQLGMNGGTIGNDANFLHFTNSTQDLFRINKNGVVLLGGNGVDEAYFQSGGAGILYTPHAWCANQFYSEQTLAANNWLFSLVTGDSNYRFYVNANGGLNWGPGNAVQDTTLYRASAGLLVTDGAFQVGEDLVCYGDFSSVALKGIVLTDRSDGHTYRIKVTNGVLGTEVVT
jgi:hypothetical protein